jgi:hypothetical protein
VLLNGYVLQTDKAQHGILVFESSKQLMPELQRHLGGLRATACSAPRVPARVRTAIPAPCRHPPAADHHHPRRLRGAMAACCTPRVVPFPREAKSHHSVGVGRRNRITTARRIPRGKLCAARRAQPPPNVPPPGARRPERPAPFRLFPVAARHPARSRRLGGPRLVQPR